MGTKMERKYEGELEEESGWTSYLETDYSNVSLFSESSTCTSNCSSQILQKDNIGKDNNYYRLATCSSGDIDDHKIVGRNGNIEEGCSISMKGVREPDFPDEELESSNSNCVLGASSTTLSHASSFSSSSPFIFSKTPYKTFYPKMHQISHPRLFKKSNHDINEYRRLSQYAAANYLPDQLLHLQDTAATSCCSPSSTLQLHAATEDTASSSTTSFKINNNERQNIFYEEDTDATVSTRFKALEALIPRLKEVAGKEEMVKVIEGHVRALELKVQLLRSPVKPTVLLLKSGV